VSGAVRDVAIARSAVRRFAAATGLRIAPSDARPQ
jgi:hypothetical protein